MMTWTHQLGGVGVCLSVLGALALAARAESSPDTALKSNLLRISQRRIFFGHQSVGMNLLEGVREIAAGHPEARVRVLEGSPGAELLPGTFAHAFMPENGNPALKLESFERAFSSGTGSKADVAFLKFCYADFSADTDARGLFSRYQAALAQLRSRYPRTVFVHVTAPLTTVRSGPRASLARLLGRAPGGLLENARREEYNELLRREYSGKEPVFDLALLESTAADGRRELHDWKGSKVPGLLPAWTDDGGHLNADARLRFARELIAFVAALP
jgi:hypothetical protein